MFPTINHIVLKVHFSTPWIMRKMRFPEYQLSSGSLTNLQQTYESTTNASRFCSHTNRITMGRLIRTVLRQVDGPPIKTLQRILDSDYKGLAVFTISNTKDGCLYYHTVFRILFELYPSLLYQVSLMDEL